MLVRSAYNLSTSNDMTSSIIYNSIIESVHSQNCLSLDIDNVRYLVLEME